MSDKVYAFEHKAIDYTILTHRYPSDGVQVQVNQWDDDEEDYVTVYDQRVIDDTYWLAVAGVMGGILDESYEELEGWLADKLDIEVSYGEDEE